jgi:hypothetical protein
MTRIALMARHGDGRTRSSHSAALRSTLSRMGPERAAARVQQPQCNFIHILYLNYLDLTQIQVTESGLLAPLASSRGVTQADPCRLLAVPPPPSLNLTNAGVPPCEVRRGSRTAAAGPSLPTRFFLPFTVSLLSLTQRQACWRLRRRRPALRLGDDQIRLVPGPDLAPSSLAPARPGAPRSSLPYRRPAWLSRPCRSVLARSGPTTAESGASLQFGIISVQIDASAPTLCPVASSSCGRQMAKQRPRSRLGQQQAVAIGSAVACCSCESLRIQAGGYAEPAVTCGAMPR